ncbi:MAG: glycoside hydrolase [Bacteroidales bacterium]|nr:glycoside hydrolase [Bacteroidales bacterium]
MKTNKTKLLAILILIISAFNYTCEAKNWVLSDSNLEITFNDATGLLSVTDRRCNKTWQQTASAEDIAVENVIQHGNLLKVKFSGKYPLEVVFKLTGQSVLEVQLSANDNMAFDKLVYPPAFQTPDKNHFLLFTDGEGFLLRADDTEYGIGRQIMHSMRGLSMPWMGVTDSDFKTGYMAIVETPDDCEIWVRRYNGLISFEPLWISQKGKFGYTRKISYRFFSEGGYVAQCKNYRDYIWSKLEVPPTLIEKQKRFPAIEKMIGAPHIYLWADARDVSFAREMKESGVNKAFILWNPNHPPYPEAGYDNRLKELGYLSGVYELFRDVHLRDTIGEIDPDNRQGTWLNRFRFPGLFHKVALVEKDGGYHYSGFGYDTNPKTVLSLIPELRTDREMEVYPHESFFLDGYLASGIFEDYGDENPLTRTEYKEAVIEMNEFFADRYNSIVGVEWGADFGVPTVAYAHGMTTLHHMLYSSPDRYKKNSIYYMGAWDNPARPSIMVGEYVADEHYLKWSINEKIRVPLYQLVYHGAIVTTWRWDDNSHNMPAIWWKKDLFDILYGTAPLWCLDRPRWEKYRQTFVESYRNIGPWLEQIQYDELVSHRFVTEDHKVQESVFSSGKKVVVNFGNSDHSYNGKTVPARSSLKILND